MKAVLTRNLGTGLVAELNAKGMKCPAHKDCKEGAEVELSDEAFQELAASGLAVTPAAWKEMKKASDVSPELTEAVVKSEKK